MHLNPVRAKLLPAEVPLEHYRWSSYPDYLRQLQFRRELLAAVSERIGPSHFGEQRQETAEQKAERLLQVELEKLGWKEESLSLVSQSQPVKVQLARLLRQETAMSLKWIASRLLMGSWTYVSKLLRAKPNPPPLNQALLPLCE